MTTTIVADLENIAAVKHVGRLTFRSGVALRSGGTTKIVTEYLHTVKPVNGVVTVGLVPGPAILQFGGTDYPFTVPEDAGANVPLWPLIAEYIKVPPDTPAQKLDAAVSRYLTENPIEGSGLTVEQIAAAADNPATPLGQTLAQSYVPVPGSAGTTGQVLAKTSTGTAWIAPPSGGGGSSGLAPDPTDSDVLVFTAGSGSNLNPDPSDPDVLVFA